MASPVANDETQLKYDVFISWNGSDTHTRDNFLNHLRDALAREKFHAFYDDPYRRQHNSLSKAIKESEVAVVIFSKSYGGSRWCLDELVKILQYRDQQRMVVLPVYYDVDLFDVRKQRGAFGDEFKKLMELDEGDKWRDALKKATYIAGLVGKDVGTKEILIEQVVNLVLKNWSGLFGLDPKIKKVQQLLNLSSDDVRTVGIWGMVGSGKTTLARAIFDIIRDEFEACCFLQDVRGYITEHGLESLERKVLSELVFQDRVRNPFSEQLDIYLTKDMLKPKRTLLVLDDVSSRESLELFSGPGWFGPGSRVIITTRDKQMLVQPNDSYEVTLLEDDVALQLLNWRVFRSRHLDNDYSPLLMKLVPYAKGLPLALSELGSLLFNKSINEWESELEKLQRDHKL